MSMQVVKISPAFLNISLQIYTWFKQRFLAVLPKHPGSYGPNVKHTCGFNLIPAVTLKVMAEGT